MKRIRQCDKVLLSKRRVEDLGEDVKTGLEMMCKFKDRVATLLFSNRMCLSVMLYLGCFSRNCGGEKQFQTEGRHITIMGGV